jgi:uncharacterized RDD family membrane protein YckC
MTDSMFVFDNRIRVKTLEGESESVNLTVRFLAFVFDSLFVIVLLFFTEIFLGAAAIQSKENIFDLLIGHLFYWGIPAQLLVFIYNGCCYLTFGATPGKLAFGLRVVSSKTLGECSLPQIFIREIVGKFFSALFMGLGFALAFIRKDGRAFHDLLSSCLVVNVRQVRRPR